MIIRTFFFVWTHPRPQPFNVIRIRVGFLIPHFPPTSLIPYYPPIRNSDSIHLLMCRRSGVGFLSFSSRTSTCNGNPRFRNSSRTVCSESSPVSGHVYGGPVPCEDWLCRNPSRRNQKTSRQKARRSATRTRKDKVARAGQRCRGSMEETQKTLLVIGNLAGNLQVGQRLQGVFWMTNGRCLGLRDCELSKATPSKFWEPVIGAITHAPARSLGTQCS